MYYKDWRLVTLQFLYLIFRKDLYVVIIGKGYFRVIIVRIFFLCFSNVDSERFILEVSLVIFDGSFFFLTFDYYIRSY